MSTTWSNQFRKYGWRPQKPDHRDFRFSAPQSVYLPRHYDLSIIYKYPPCYDQGQLGSCTGNAIAGALEADQIRQKLPEATPSRLFIYYYERVMENTVSEDAGAEIRDGIKVTAQNGVCKETTWPYVISRFTTEPSLAARTEAAQHRSVKYMAVNQTLKDIKTAIVLGYPVVFGISVYESFESDAASKTGVIPMPAKTESMLGGHAILLVGYCNYYKAFKFRNSWGPSWGDNGYGYLPYQYVTDPNLASDFWAIETTK